MLLGREEGADEGEREREDRVAESHEREAGSQVPERRRCHVEPPGFRTQPGITGPLRRVA